LLRVYARCLDDGEGVSNKRIDAALRPQDGRDSFLRQVKYLPERERASRIYPAASGSRQHLMASSCLPWAGIGGGKPPDLVFWLVAGVGFEPT
jgi:hypothetical protein